MLLDYAHAANGNGLKQIYLVHGDEGPAQVLMEKMREEGITNVRFPELGEIAEF